MARPYTDKRDYAKDATFCEALAEGASLAAAGRAIGVTSRPARKRFDRICRDLGEQAQ